jgi:hypothetical protein
VPHLDPGRTTLVGEAATVRAAANEFGFNGYRVGGRLARQLRPALSANGRVSVLDFGAAAGAVFEAGAELTWRPVDRWTLGGGYVREALFENLETIGAGLVASGIVARAEFESPSVSMTTTTRWQDLSDRNRRVSVQASLSRIFSERVRDLRLIGWGEVLSFGQRATSYFSPGSFVRLDGGIEYTYRLNSPRFRGDRADALTASYLVGTDSDGALYQHPSVRLTREFQRGLSLEGRADLIRSASYRESSFSVSLKVTGAAELSGVRR